MFYPLNTFRTYFPMPCINHCIKFWSITFAFGSCDLKEIVFQGNNFALYYDVKFCENVAKIPIDLYNKFMQTV